MNEPTLINVTLMLHKIGKCNGLNYSKEVPCPYCYPDLYEVTV